MKTRIALTFIFLISLGSAYGQQAADTTQQKNIWDKKFFWGLTLNNALVTIKGAPLPMEYFWKPSIGLTARTEYFFHKNFGISVGLGFQQKGSGIITPDKISNQSSSGNPDSTHRARIRFNAYEIPIALIFRSGEVFKATRIHVSIGINPTKIGQSKYVFYSIEDGLHKFENHSDRYYKTDVPISASLGFDFNAGNACVFQVHLIGNWGTRNVYNQNAFPGSNGKNYLYGLRLGWLF